ncbi:MAG: LytTR family transcriptional regulator [Bacteroidales bacterium]|nr:LytTR family transcriptional regulator [Bacteroidales bacterium]
MKTISRTFYKMPVNTLFIVGVPLFYFLFVLAYNPFGIEEFLSVGAGHTLNLIICTLIVLGVISISRMLLYILRRRIDLNWALYILWCFGEVILCGLYMSIPMGIGWAGAKPYFTVMSHCVLSTWGILVFPLSIFSMAVQLYVLDQPAGPVADEKTLIRFHDSEKRLKLVVASENVLYVEAEDNYVHIVHLDGGKIKDFELRSSMRALEDILQRHGLVRCHRSFFLNAAHVELLKKDAGGYALAQLDQPGAKAIPVSKRYYSALTALL